jgi:hypothetical protein
MRRTIATITGLLLLATASTAFASGAGLPTLAQLHLGTDEATLYSDSPALHTGTNTFTLAIPGLPEAAHVLLTAIGPDGRAVDVDLQPLTVLGGDAHDDMSDMPGMSHDSAAAGHDMAGMNHDMAGMNHDHAAAAPATAPAPEAGHDHAAAAPEAAHSDSGHSGHDAHSDLPTSGYVARGTARLSQTGTWTLLVEASDGHAGTSDKVKLDVVQGGPSRLYLAATGSLIGGFLIYGAVGRRRQRTGGK